MVSAEASASGYFVRCAGVHATISATRLRSIFRRDWDLSGVRRYDFMIWRVNPRSARRIQWFMDKNIPDKWTYDGEAILVQREGKVHSVILYADSVKYGPSLVVIAAERGTAKELALVLLELKARVQRPVVAYSLDNKIEQVENL